MFDQIGKRQARLLNDIYVKNKITWFLDPQFLIRGHETKSFKGRNTILHLYYYYIYI